MAQQDVQVPMPMIMIKDEVLSDSEEVHCRLCHKSFASTIALRNHARMDHIEAYENGDPTVWTKSQDDPVVISKSGQKIVIQRRKQGVLAKVGSSSITSSSSNNVSYIIIKSDNAQLTKKKRVRKEKDWKAEKEDKKIMSMKRTKSPQAIAGPFECVEPSALGSDGTCHQIFFSCCAYSQHLRLEHTRRRKAARCQVCERALPVPGADGDTDKPYACDTCYETFASADDLQTHTTRSHVKLKPYECSVCHKRFTQQGGVVQHMRMHSGDRPFPCTFCEKAFTQKSGLDQHIRTHTKVKPYRCVVCGKSFVQSVHLKQHMRTHTNLTPFQCVLCNKRFKQSSHLNYHLRNHNPISLTSEQKERYNALVGTIHRAHAATSEQHDTSERVENSEQENTSEQISYVKPEDVEESYVEQDVEESYVEEDVEESYVDEDVEEGYVEEESYVEQEEVEQMESGSYEVDPREICTVEQINGYASQATTYIIGGTYEDSGEKQ